MSRRTIPTERSLVLLAILLAMDAAFISGDILHRHGVLADRRFSVNVDHGFGEMFEYGKLAAAAALLGWTAVRWRSWAVAFWALLFAYLGIDDGFSVHEQMGGILARRLALPRVGNVRPADIGELIFLGAAGAVVALGIAFILFSTSSRARRLTWTLVGGVLALAFFGVGVDLLHRIVSRTWLEPAVAVLEDGGEMVATSVLLWMTTWLPSRAATDNPNGGARWADQLLRSDPRA